MKYVYSLEISSVMDQIQCHDDVICGFSIDWELTVIIICFDTVIEYQNIPRNVNS